MTCYLTKFKGKEIENILNMHFDLGKFYLRPLMTSHCLLNRFKKVPFKVLGEWLAEITIADANISNAWVEDSKLNKLASQDYLTLQ